MPLNHNTKLLFYETSTLVECTFEAAPFFKKARDLLKPDFRTSKLVLEELNALSSRRRRSYSKLTNYLATVTRMDEEDLFGQIEAICLNKNDCRHMKELLSFCIRKSRNPAELKINLLSTIGRVNRHFSELILLIERNQARILISDRLNPVVFNALHPLFTNEMDRRIISNVISVSMFEYTAYLFVTKDVTDFYSKRNDIYRAVYGIDAANPTVVIIPLQDLSV